MSSIDVERQHKLNNDFENVSREHDRLQKDFDIEHDQQYQISVESINSWEKNSIKKIRNAATKARDDLQKLFNDRNQQLKRYLTGTVTEGLRDALEGGNNFTSHQLDKWLINLSEIRRLLENLSSSVHFSYGKTIRLIQVKQNHSLKTIESANCQQGQFYFEKIHGHPIFYTSEYFLSTARPATIISQNAFSTGTHFFHFRIDQTTDEIFFGIISDDDIQNLKRNKHPIRSIYGWWNIDHRVLAGQKESLHSAFKLHAGDEIIIIINCNTNEILLTYPSMNKSNKLQLRNIHQCPIPWRLLIEVGKPGRCLLKLLDWR